jgi:hypothetical protein
VALAPLAIQADLAARGVDANPVLAGKMLDAASRAVREAAGSVISQETSTIAIPGVKGRYLQLPSQPVRSVSAVLIDGAAVTDYKLTAGALWRYYGWMWPSATWSPGIWACAPTEVTVTMTHGMDVPEDIVQLVCNLAIAGINTAARAPEAGVTEEAIDDHRTVYATGADAAASVFELPDRTRLMLATRFGGGANVTAER